MMENIAAHSVTHLTEGHIARVGSTELTWDGSQYVTTAVAHLELTYAGTLASDKYVSLVDDTLNSNFPCADGSVAAAGADSQHSGVAQGSSSVVTYDTSGMDTSKTFAACYTEGDGTSSASWVDSGIRLSVSKLTAIEYGTYSS